MPDPSSTTRRERPLSRDRRSTSEARASRDTPTTSARGSVAAYTGVPARSRTLLSSSSSAASMRPCSRDASMSSRSSAGPCTTLASSTGSTFQIPSSTLAIPLSSRRTHRVAAMNRRNGSPIRMADRSGWLIAHDFGAISPTTIWRNTTTATAMTVAMTEAMASGNGVSWSRGSSRSATAGLASAPSPRVARVIPSCAPARPRESSRLLRTAARAERPPKAAATSRRCRFAETTRELRRHEERVGEQQQHGEPDGDRDVHDARSSAGSDR